VTVVIWAGLRINAGDAQPDKRHTLTGPLLSEDAQERKSMNPGNVAPWSADWAWGLPLIVLTVVLHAYGLGLLNNEVTTRLSNKERLRHPVSVSTFLVGGTALSATMLHGIEGLMWAVAYRFLGALPDHKSAMLYSLSAMTSYGHADVFLAPHWRMMGALESLNGWILFGLTTAFLFTVIQKAWPHAHERQK